VKIEITNQQKIKKITFKALRAQIAKVCGCLEMGDVEISFLLCDDVFIQKLNKKFFKRDMPTDVIAFGLKDKGCFGEVIVSVERAVLAAPKYGNCWQDEFLTYVIHGILHVHGYTDGTSKSRAKMFKKQDEVFNFLANSPK